MGKNEFLKKAQSLNVTEEDLKILEGLNTKQIIAFIYTKAIWDVRNEIASKLPELDPTGRFENKMRQINDIIKNTPFQGLNKG